MELSSKIREVLESKKESTNEDKSDISPIQKKLI